MSLKFDLETIPNGQLLHLSGHIDENADFSKVPLPGKGAFYIDLERIEGLNSIGLRNWLHWVMKMDRGATIILQRCPHVVLHQMNILDGFLPFSAVVQSVEVPFYCESCGAHSSYWAERGRDYIEPVGSTSGKILMPLTKKCENCGETSEADIFPDKHFLFLRSSSR